MTFEHYIRNGQKVLRLGYTTGTCAALATQGALRLLIEESSPETLELATPYGLSVSVSPSRCERLDESSALCSVIKDAGDDYDVTDTLEIVATVRLTDDGRIHIDGGEGVGRVTKPGLDQALGEAAINSTPRAMIKAEAQRLLAALNPNAGVVITISVPEGKRVAQNTFNPSLGIEGGISILGTSGVVEPMSTEALVATIEVELSQAYAQGLRNLIVVPGNYATDFIEAQGWNFSAAALVKCSNYLGDALDAAVSRGFRRILVVAHIGKLVKVAAGIMNTHSRMADGRREILTAYAACLGAAQALCRALMKSVTTDACIELLDQAGLREPVMKAVMDAVQQHLQHRVGSEVTIGAVMFSNQYGLLGRTAQGKTFLTAWQEVQ